MAQRKKKHKARNGKAIATLIEQRGGVAQFARDLSKVSGKPVSWGCVNAWKIRNTISKGMVLYVHQLTGAPLQDLLR